MTAPKISQRVREMICQHLLCGPSEIVRVVDEANIFDDLQADSLDAVELAIAIKEKFSVEIDDILLSDTPLVGDIIKLVKEKVQA